MSAPTIETTNAKIKPERPAFTRRLDEFGWALFLLALGMSLLLPDNPTPDLWILAAGVIVLGIEAVRFFAGYRLRLAAIVIGMVALAAGLQSVLGLTLALFPLALVAAGIAILLKPMFERINAGREAS